MHWSFLINCSWLLWSDKQKGTIERIGVDGRGRSVISVAASGRCIGAIALEFNTKSVYWVDTCFHRLHSVRIDGEHTGIILVKLPRLVSRGISIFEGYLYWSIVKVSNNHISRLNWTAGPTLTQVSGPINSEINGIEVVHPSRQPEISEYSYRLTMYRIQCTSTLANNGAPIWTYQTIRTPQMVFMLLLLALSQCFVWKNNDLRYFEDVATNYQ